MEKGGLGLMLFDLVAKDTLSGAAIDSRRVKSEGIGLGGKDHEVRHEFHSPNHAQLDRAKRGEVVKW